MKTFIVTIYFNPVLGHVAAESKRAAGVDDSNLGNYGPSDKTQREWGSQGYVLSNWHLSEVGVNIPAK